MGTTTGRLSWRETTSPAHEHRAQRQGRLCGAPHRAATSWNRSRSPLRAIWSRGWPRRGVTHGPHVFKNPLRLFPQLWLVACREPLQKLVASLPQPNRRVLLHVCEFLRGIDPGATRMTADNLAICFAPCLFRCEDMMMVRPANRVWSSRRTGSDRRRLFRRWRTRRRRFCSRGCSSWRRPCRRRSCGRTWRPTRPTRQPRRCRGPGEFCRCQSSCPTIDSDQVARLVFRFFGWSQEPQAAPRRRGQRRHAHARVARLRVTRRVSH